MSDIALSHVHGRVTAHGREWTVARDALGYLIVRTVCDCGRTVDGLVGQLVRHHLAVRCVCSAPDCRKSLAIPSEVESMLKGLKEPM